MAFVPTTGACASASFGDSFERVSCPRDSSACSSYPVPILPRGRPGAFRRGPFPDSMFSEERDALRIEILQRTHPDEAARRLREFDRHFPRSVYRRRIAQHFLPGSARY